MDGPPAENILSDTRAAILRHVRQHPGSTPKAIAEATGLGNDNVKKACQRMTADGQLTADAAGRYRLPGTPEPPEGVPGVPRVPQPLLTCENASDHGGHPGGQGVPGVPRHPLTSANDASGSQSPDEEC